MSSQLLHHGMGHDRPLQLIRAHNGFAPAFASSRICRGKASSSALPNQVSFELTADSNGSRPGVLR